MSSPSTHSCLDDHGKPVVIQKPSEPTSKQTWTDPSAIAIVVPGGEMPSELNGIPFESNTKALRDMIDLVQEQPLLEPDFPKVAGKKPSAGVVIREPDGRVWLVAPTNGFGGYLATFPKGRLEGKSAQEAAVVEAFEESGLVVRLISHLVDVVRTTTVTRYYLAERVSGNPSDMGWESQAVMLVPAAKLGEILNNQNDIPIVKAF